MIYIVSTPIGNLKDISLRAIETLKSVDLILAEDTRRTGILLKEYEIDARMISFNDNNKEKKTKELAKDLKTKEIALVSDAGTPGISDPGFYLARYCVENDIRITPVPGASALLSALVCSGLPTDRFCFLGFLPKKQGKKKELLSSLPEMTAVAYESPHRILKTLEMMSDIIPDKNIVLARELTKKFEEFLRGKPKELLERLKNPKGEFVIVISK